MIRTRLHRSIAGLVAGTALATAALGLAGCSGGTTPAASTSSAPSATGAGALPPIIADLGSIDGTTVQVPLGNTIDLTGDDKDFTHWTADIADAKIVSFAPGKDDGSAQFNPGLDALAEGTTKVTMDNSASGKHVAFTVEVTAKK
ncbi:hypothetical protein [Microbacterium azadirachtae]|uniref:MSP domain-containing protein n=1 Tax=Microbacterium azadirachtae TaxID=582680 RepID=A0A0F0LQ52_9MICO|nr:hypothetical protein [Microbacterium azadirachtae]KJL34400.1 hypothetical protein RS86_00886 [Microbacterium azadirachtae]